MPNNVTEFLDEIAKLATELKIDLIKKFFEENKATIPHDLDWNCLLNNFKKLRSVYSAEKCDLEPWVFILLSGNSTWVKNNPMLQDKFECTLCKYSTLLYAAVHDDAHYLVEIVKQIPMFDIFIKRFDLNDIFCVLARFQNKKTLFGLLDFHSLTSEEINNKILVHHNMVTIAAQNGDVGLLTTLILRYPLFLINSYNYIRDSLQVKNIRVENVITQIYDELAPILYNQIKQISSDWAKLLKILNNFCVNTPEAKARLKSVIDFHVRRLKSLIKSGSEEQLKILIKDLAELNHIPAFGRLMYEASAKEDLQAALKLKDELLDDKQKGRALNKAKHDSFILKIQSAMNYKNGRAFYEFVLVQEFLGTPLTSLEDKLYRLYQSAEYGCADGLRALQQQVNIIDPTSFWCCVYRGILNNNREDLKFKTSALQTELKKLINLFDSKYAAIRFESKLFLVIVDAGLTSLDDDDVRGKLIDLLLKEIRQTKSSECIEKFIAVIKKELPKQSADLFCDLALDTLLNQEQRLLLLKSIDIDKLTANQKERFNDCLVCLPPELSDELAYAKSNGKSVKLVLNAEKEIKDRVEGLCQTANEELLMALNLDDYRTLIAWLIACDINKEHDLTTHHTANNMRSLLSQTGCDLLFYLMNPQTISAEIKTSDQIDHVRQLFRTSLTELLQKASRVRPPEEPPVASSSTMSL